MLSKLYESTEVDRRTWLHVPLGTHCSTSSDTHQVVEIEKETSTKMYTTSCLDLNIKVIDSYIHTKVYHKRNDFGFPIITFPWLSVDVLRNPSHDIYISQLVRFLRVVLAFWISIIKKIKLL